MDEPNGRAMKSPTKRQRVATIGPDAARKPAYYAAQARIIRSPVAARSQVNKLNMPLGITSIPSTTKFGTKTRQ